ncbi:MAG: S-layer homology domain-containing protein [Clostridia bacterium]|nr:S-layer homology domain-containing protein [Clostridia bacterium]
MRMKKWLASLLAATMLVSMSSFSFAEEIAFEDENQEFVEEAAERVLMADAVYRETAFRELNFGAPLSFTAAAVTATRTSFVASSTDERGKISYTVTNASDVEPDAEAVEQNNGLTEVVAGYPDAVLNVIRNTDTDWGSFAIAAKPFNNAQMLKNATAAAKQTMGLRVSASVRVGAGQETYTDPTLVGAGISFGNTVSNAAQSAATFNKEPYLTQTTVFGKNQTLTFLVGAVDAVVNGEEQKAGEWLRIFGADKLLASVKLDNPVDTKGFVTFEVLQVATVSDANALNGCNIYVTVGDNTVVLNCPVENKKQNVSINGTATNFSIYNNTGKGLSYALGAGFIASYTESSLDYFRMSVLEAVEDDSTASLQAIEATPGMIEFDSDMYPDGMDLQAEGGLVINKYVGANDAVYGAEKTAVEITDCDVYALNPEIANIDETGKVTADYVGAAQFLLVYEENGKTAQTLFTVNAKSRLTPLLDWIDTFNKIDLNAMIPQVPLSFSKFWEDGEEEATLSEIITYAQQQADVRPIISQEEIDEIVSNMESIYNNLPLATVWKQAVLKAASVDSYYAYDYTEDSYAALVAAKDALLEEVYAEKPSNETMIALMADVDAAIEALENADHSDQPEKPAYDADFVEVVMGATQIPCNQKTSFRVFATYTVDGAPVVYDVTADAVASVNNTSLANITGNTVFGKGVAGSVVLTVTCGDLKEKISVTMMNKDDFVPVSAQNHLYDRHSLVITNGDAFAISVNDVVIPAVESQTIDKKDTETNPYITFIVGDESVARYENSIGAIRGIKEGSTYVVAMMPTLQRNIYSLPVIITVSEAGVQAEYTEENGYAALAAASDVAENYNEADMDTIFAQLSDLYNIEVETDGEDGSVFFREIAIMKENNKEIDADAVSAADTLVDVLNGLERAAKSKRTSDIIDAIEPAIEILELDMEFFEKLELEKFRKATYVNLLEAYIETEEEADSDLIRALWLEASKKAYEDEQDYEPVKTNPGKGTGGGGGGNFTFNAGIPAVVTPTDAFPDIASVTWAKDAINNLAKKNIIAGYPDGEYKPNNLVTRDEFAKLVVEVFGYNEVSGIRFNDIPADGWQVAYVDRAATGGVVLGVGDNMFGSGANITRQDACVMIYRALQKKGYTLNAKNASVTFSDMDTVDAYAQEAVNAMNNAGLFTAMTEGQFMPQTACTRAMVAYLLYGAMQNLGL